MIKAVWPKTIPPIINVLFFFFCPHVVHWWVVCLAPAELDAAHRWCVVFYLPCYGLQDIFQNYQGLH